MRKHEKPLYLVEYGPNAFHMSFVQGLYDRLFKARAALASATYAGRHAACVRIVRIGADTEPRRVVYANF